MSLSCPYSVSARVAAIGLAGLLALLPHAAPAQQAGPNPEVLETLCRTCHADQFRAQESNPHRVLDSDAWRDLTGNQPGCVNCHGDASQHISERGGRGNIFAFREESPAAINGVCLDCHASSHPEFERSAHAQAGLSCGDCHQQHGEAQTGAALLRVAPDLLGRLERLGPESAVCTDCHEDVFSAFALNERHRLREGALECVSCHDPHAPATRTLLGAFRQQQCLDCHTDKGGPFVFEHAASRVEGCTACHAVHGSPNRHLLSHQRVAELCISCHAVLPQFHLSFNPAAAPRFDLDTQCTNCHSTIHGSNLDPAFLK